MVLRAQNNNFHLTCLDTRHILTDRNMFASLSFLPMTVSIKKFCPPWFSVCVPNVKHVTVFLFTSTSLDIIHNPLAILFFLTEFDDTNFTLSIRDRRSAIGQFSSASASTFHVTNLTVSCMVFKRSLSAYA